MNLLMPSCEIDRARKHLAELEKLIDNIRWSELVSRFPKRCTLAAMTGNCLVNSMEAPFRSIIGDFIHNIRSALNYIAIGVWRFDSLKIEPSRSFQFPIESRQDEFLRKRASTFKGISDKHIALFEQFQPCYGCNWTRLLVSLSNEDKHWGLVPVDLYINRAGIRRRRRSHRL